MLALFKKSIPLSSNLRFVSLRSTRFSLFRQPARLVARALFIAALGVSTLADQPTSVSSTRITTTSVYPHSFGTMAWSCSSDSNEGLITKLRRGGLIKSAVVEQAMRAIDRGHYVPEAWKQEAYADSPLPIGYGATISAPHMHAMCLELLKDNMKPGSNVLDVGSGSGYLTACMAAMVAPNGRVYGVEHIPELVEASKRSVAREDAKISGLLELRTTDGRHGYPDKAPYDAIHVGAAAPRIPQALVDQLKIGGKMVIPVGPDGGNQELYLIEKKSEDEIDSQVVCGVRYVPLTDAKKQAPSQRDEGVPYTV